MNGLERAELERQHRILADEQRRRAPTWDGYEHQRPVDPLPPRPSERVGLTNPPADVRPCACGEDIVMLRPVKWGGESQEPELARVMQVHQIGDRHATWRARELDE